MGHKGDDLLIGGSRKDTFVFHKNHGDDTIRDFTSGQDQIEIGRGASRLGQLDITQQQGDVFISFSNLSILVEDASWSEIAQADNFLFLSRCQTAQDKKARADLRGLCFASRPVDPGAAFS
jgi:hypothetical protein